MIRLFRKTFASMKEASVPLLVFEILFKLGIGMCIIPVITLLFNLALKLSGFVYISKRNFWVLLKNPLIIFMIIFIVFIFILVILIETASLTLFFGQKFKQKKQYIKKLLFLSLKESRRVLKWKNFSLFLYMLSSLPFFQFILSFGYIMSNMELSQFIFGQIRTAPHYILLTGLLVVILFYFAVRYLFALCYYFLEHKPVREAFHESANLTRGRILKTAASILLCNLFYILIYALFYLIVIGLVVVFTKLFGFGRLGLTIFLMIFNFTNRIVVLLISSLEMISNVSLVVNLYFQYTRKERVVSSIIVSGKRMRQKFPIRLKRLIAVCLTVLAALNLLSVYFLIKEDGALFVKNKVEVTSHRGNSNSAPENTIPSLEAAVKEMADYAEIDAQETKDGIVVLLHDTNLKRTTGVKADIWKKNYEDVRKLDAGVWFGKEFAGVPIPTLEEAVQYAKGRIKLNIELKPNKKKKQKLEKSVVNIIEKYDFIDECVVSSFSYESLIKVKKLNPKIKTGYILSPVYGEFYDLKYADFYSLEKNYITPRMVYQIHQRGKEVHVWTVNTAYYLERMEKMGVDNIITDDAVLARNVLYSKNIPDYTMNFLKLIFKLN